MGLISSLKKLINGAPAKMPEDLNSPEEIKQNLDNRIAQRSNTDQSAPGTQEPPVQPVQPTPAPSEPSVLSTPTTPPTPQPVQPTPAPSETPAEPPVPPSNPTENQQL